MSANFIGMAGVCFTVLLQTMLFCFWLGKLSERVKQVEIKATGDATTHDAVVRLQVEMEHANSKLDSMERAMQGVNRALGNITTGRMTAGLMGGD